MKWSRTSACRRALIAASACGALSVSALGQTAAHLAGPGRTFQRTNRFVVTSVFHWYGTDTGQLSGPWRPLEGRPAWTGEPDFWQGQIKQIMSANIDMMYVHLFDHVHEQQRVNLFKALGQLRAQGYAVPKVVPFLDPPLTWFDTQINVATTAGKDAFASQYIRFFNQYYSVNTDAHADSYIGAVDGRPMLDTWHVFLNLTNINSLTRADVTSRLSAAFGAEHPLFNQNVYMITTALNPPTLAFADEKVPQFEVNEYFRDTTFNGLRTAQLKPGYWDENVRNPGSQLKRDGGTHYAAAWNQAVAARSTLRRVMVESWNEYDEGSGIYAANPGPPYILPGSGNVNTDVWSTTNDPYEYIKTTADAARRFNDTPDRDARILWHNLPDSLAPGESRTVTVIVRNEGDLSWTAAGQYKFGQQDFVPGEVLFGPGRYLLDDSADEIPIYGGIFRGRPVTFQVELTAPAAVGSYVTHWGMLQENVAWFGQTLQRTIGVSEAPAAQVCDIPFDLTLPAIEFAGAGVRINVGRDPAGQPVPARLTVGTVSVSSAAAGNVLHSEQSINGVNITGTLQIGPTGALRRTGSGVTRVANMQIHPTAALDLANSDLIWDYTGNSPLLTVRSLLARGYDGGAWTGGGITSAGARDTAAGNGFRTGLGYGEASLMNLAAFAGEPLDSTCVVIAYTFLGDANLDRKVNLTDFGFLAAYFNQSAGWSSGDFNYDGSVTLSDFSLLAANWQAGVATPLRVQSIVPEPASSAALLLITSPWIFRRAARCGRATAATPGSTP